MPRRATTLINRRTQKENETEDLQTRARGGAIDCKTIVPSEEGVTDAGDRASRSSKRQDPPSRKKGSRTTKHLPSRNSLREVQRTHVERVTPAADARRKFAPTYWTTARGASDAPKSNAAPGRSKRKTPCQTQAYHASSGRTKNKRRRESITDEDDKSTNS